MKTNLWIVIVMVSGIVGFLVGYSVSSYTGTRKIQNAQVKEAEGGVSAQRSKPDTAKPTSGGYGAQADTAKPTAGGYGAATPAAPKPAAGGYGAPAPASPKTDPPARPAAAKVPGY